MSALVADDFEPDEKERQAAKLNAENLLAERIKGIIGRLEREADNRIMRRYSVEQRWIEDLRQYHGQYDPKTAGRLSKSGLSQVFVNQTRPKTNAMAARIYDLLFPTDDRNWGLSPTPVPELAEQAKQAASAAIALREQAIQMAKQQTEQANAGQTADVAALEQATTKALEAEKTAADLDATMAEAKRRSDLMSDEIRDQLVECNYAARARDAIDDACRLGTGVMKGPMVGESTRPKWTQRPQQPGQAGPAVYEMQKATDPRPLFHHVNVWDFFPDPDARCIADSDGIFERHLMKARDLRRLKGQPGFSDDALRRLLTYGSRDSLPSYVADLKAITNDQVDTAADYYQVWEYHGTLQPDEMTAILLATRPELARNRAFQEFDVLQEVHVTVWFCQGEVLKFGIHQLDSNEPIYSVYNLEKDESSIFGFGVPYLMRHPQAALNGAWRMLMDNGGLSSGPQIVVDRESIEPANGDWALAARKLWFAKKPMGTTNEPFKTFNVDGHHAELIGVIDTAMKFIDDETAMPQIAQGEPGTQAAQTVGGMSILMNAANVVFRRVVKNWDDDVTVPNIRRIYDWNMQFSKKDYIKGDLQCEARGSSVLLVREMQAQNLMAIAINFAGHPIFGPMLKNPSLLRKIFQAFMLPSQEVMLTDEEIERAAALAAQQAPQEDPAVAIKRMEIESRERIATMESESRLQVETLRHETQMMKLAENLNLSLDKIRAQLQDKREQRASDERQFAAEAAMTSQIGPSGGGFL